MALRTVETAALTLATETGSPSAARRPQALLREPHEVVGEAFGREDSLAPADLDAVEALALGGGEAAFGLRDGRAELRGDVLKVRHRGLGSQVAANVRVKPRLCDKDRVQRRLCDIQGPDSSLEAHASG